ncbi:MAG: hypothetical protein ACLFVR_00625 [Thiohalospira sp.]
MNKIKEQKRNMEFQVKGIEILDIELKNPEKQLPKDPVFHYNINLLHKINPEKKLVFVIVEVNVLNEDKQTLLGRIRVSNVFHVVNFDEFKVDKTDRTVSFPKEIIDVFNSIAISTTRGVMFTSFRGTFLHTALLPLINPKGFRQENIVKK